MTSIATAEAEVRFRYRSNGLRWCDRGDAFLARADTVNLLHGLDEDLAVADFSGTRRAHQRPDRGVDERLRDADLQTDLLDELHLDRRATVRLDLFGLAAVALRPAEGQAADIDIQAREILRLRTALNRILVETTGQDAEKLRADTDRDYIMDAEQSMEYGIIDEVISERS